MNYILLLSIIARVTFCYCDRLQTLLDKKKADALTSTENLELEAIGELDEIFSYINAAIATRSEGID